MKIAFEICILWSILVQKLAKGQICKQPGQCSNAIAVGASPATQYNDCLNICTGNPNCNWLTYHEDSQFCDEYFDCPQISPSCSDCFTSEKGCPLETGAPQCNIPGQCFGVSIHNNITSSISACISLCQTFPDCEYWTYYGDSGTCQLTSGCDFNNACSNCYTGERRCYGTTNYQLLMVIGGRHSEKLVEVVDLSGQNRVCGEIKRHPIDEQTVSTFMDGKVWTCGGGFPLTTQCYAYYPLNFTWKSEDRLSLNRRYSAGVLVSPNEWWITGGHTSDANNPTETTELYTVGQGLSDSIDLPKTFAAHHVLQMMDNSLIILEDESSAQTVYRMNQFPVQSYTPLASLTESRSVGAAGLVRFGNGTVRIVASGGTNSISSEIYSFEDDRWSPGPDLPAIVGQSFMYGAASVQYEDTFLVIGGYSEAYTELNTILKYNLNTEDWEVLTQRLTNGRYFFSAVLIPDDYISCSTL